MTERTGARLEALLAVVFWGGSFTAIKMVVSQVSPLTLLWLRFGIGAVVLGGILWVKHGFHPLSFRQVVELCFLGFLGIFLHNYIQSLGLRTAAAGISGLIIAGTPTLIALLGAFFLREALSSIQLGGIFLAAFGVLFIVSKGHLSSLWSGWGNVGNLGERLVLLSSFTWALFSVLSRRILQRMSSSLAMFYVILSGWIFCSVPFFFQGSQDVFILDKSGWYSVIFLGVFCSAIAYVFWYDALKKLPASEVGAFLYLNPIVAVAVATFFLDEPISFSTLVGGGLVLIGVGIVNYREES